MQPRNIYYVFGSNLASEKFFIRQVSRLANVLKCTYLQCTIFVRSRLKKENNGWWSDINSCDAFVFQIKVDKVRKWYLTYLRNLNTVRQSRKLYGRILTLKRRYLWKQPVQRVFNFWPIKFCLEYSTSAHTWWKKLDNLVREF